MPVNDILQMFDATPALAAHRAHARGERYTLPDYPAPGGVPIKLPAGAPERNDAPQTWPQAQPQGRSARAALSPSLADAMAAARRLGGRFTSVQLATELYGEANRSTRGRIWVSLRELMGRGLIRRAGSLPRTGRPPAQTLFEIVPEAEAGEA